MLRSEGSENTRQVARSVFAVNGDDVAGLRARREAHRRSNAFLIIGHRDLSWIG
jgi:hypothetical protein